MIRAAVIRWLQETLLPWLGSLVIRALRLTLRLRTDGLQNVRPYLQQNRPIIIAFWHGQLLLMPYAYEGRKASVLVSEHRDGRFIGNVISHWGFNVAHGSRTRGGLGGFRALVRSLRKGVTVAITPDGPRGPARKADLGTVLLAKAAGVPILPLAFSCSKKKSSAPGMASQSPFLSPAPCFCGANP